MHRVDAMETSSIVTKLFENNVSNLIFWSINLPTSIFLIDYVNYFQLSSSRNVEFYNCAFVIGLKA